LGGEERKTEITVIELFGFFVWNFTSVLFLVFLVWTFVPEHILNKMGITFYRFLTSMDMGYIFMKFDIKTPIGISFIPNKYYALAIPTWMAVSALLLVMGYAASGLFFSHNRDSYLTMQDRCSILHDLSEEVEAESPYHR
jgi:hypothetical protein